MRVANEAIHPNRGLTTPSSSWLRRVLARSSHAAANSSNAFFSLSSVACFALIRQSSARLRYSATFSIEETSLQIPLPLPRGKATRTVLDVRYCTNPSASTQYLRTQCSPSLSEAPLRSQAANRRRGCPNVRRGEAIGWATRVAGGDPLARKPASLAWFARWVGQR